MSEEFIFNDGRKAEKVEIDQGKTKVIEVYVEPKLEKKLAQRITEKYCVCEREIETIDESTGEVIDRVVEKVSNGQVVSSLNDDKKLENETKSPMEKVVEEKLKDKTGLSVGNLVLIGVILVQVLGLAYLLFVV